MDGLTPGLTDEELGRFAKLLGHEVRTKGSDLQYRDPRFGRHTRFRWVGELGADHWALSELIRLARREGEHWTLEYINGDRTYMVNLGIRAQGLGPTPGAAIIRAMLAWED